MSDYHIEKVLEAYVSRILARDYARSRRGGAISENTVYSIYNLVRRRMLDIGHYQEPKDYWQFWQSDGERASQFAFSDAAYFLEAQSIRMRGLDGEAARYVLAEIIFWAENQQLPPGAYLNDIKLAVSITGPLNRPPINLDIWKERSYIAELDRQIGALRFSKKPSRAFNARQIETLERVRSGAATRLRQKLRLHGVRANVLPKKPD